MTVKQVYENIQQAFPELKALQIIPEMDAAQNRFARETKILRKIGNLQTLTSKVAWALPNDFVELYEVELYDSNGKSLNKVDQSIDWFIDDGYLIFYDTSSTKKITTIPTGINAIWTRYAHYPRALDADNITGDNSADTTFDIGTHYGEAVLAGALSGFYGRIRIPLGVDREGNVILGIDTRSRDFWEKKFHELKIEAKRAVNSWDSTERRTMNFEHAGLYELPKEAKNATVSTTSWS